MTKHCDQWKYGCGPEDCTCSCPGCKAEEKIYIDKEKLKPGNLIRITVRGSFQTSIEKKR